MLTKQEEQKALKLMGSVIGTAACIGGASLYCYFNWRTARPDQVLVKTGLLVTGKRGMNISRRFLRLPGQMVESVSMTPKSLSFDLNCLSKQYLPFDMPVTYTVAPFDPNSEEMFEGTDQDGNVKVWTSDDLFRNFSERMAHLEDDEFKKTILGVVHGETRVQAAQMDIDAINDDRDAFRHTVTQKIQKSLFGLGVRVTNANIAELKEKERKDQMGYLKARERKKLADAVERSEIDVKEREADRRQNIALLEAKTLTSENEQAQIIAESKAKLAEVEAETRRRAEIANVEADAARETRTQELQKAIEEATARQTVEAKRAVELTAAKVDAECKVREAEGKRDAAIEEAKGKAEAIRLVAEAEKAKGIAMAQAKFADLEAQAQGELSMLEARAKGAELLVEACGANSDILTNILAVQNEIPQAAYKGVADAVKGMNPQVFSISGNNPGSDLARIVGGFAPTLEAFNKIWKSSDASEPSISSVPFVPQKQK